ncbi:F-box and leucine-rich protein 22 isoform X2 [Anguilla anguilla]|uniref:F-box and leucine-rich protein 22 isoform X2 n=1 Tax=Anguilla anguilla TaxID=7936 RepID=UPI0015AB3482|nr:F-box and leucine-rich protein 22 isoform X2 [Anguilla anguilla]
MGSCNMTPASGFKEAAACIILSQCHHYITTFITAALLVTMILGCPSGITDASFFVICQAACPTSAYNVCPNLLSLTLSGCGHIEDQDVVLVLQSCRRLRSLRLENCVRITDSLLHAVVAHGDSLAAVQVDFCRNVTQSGLQVVRAGRPGVRLSAERSAGMIPDGRPQEKPQPLRRALQKVLLFS